MMEQTHTEQSDSRRGWFWLAYYGDWSGFAAFADEMSALRYAVEHSMPVMEVPFGESVREYVGGTRS